MRVKHVAHTLSERMTAGILSLGRSSTLRISRFKQAQAAVTMYLHVAARFITDNVAERGGRTVAELIERLGEMSEE